MNKLSMLRVFLQLFWTSSMLFACGPSGLSTGIDAEEQGIVDASFRLTGISEVSRVNIKIPPNVDKNYQLDSQGRVSDQFVLTAGVHKVTAVAYKKDNSTTPPTELEVARAEGEIIVTTASVSQLSLALLDATGGQKQPDFGPVITLIKGEPTVLSPGQTVTVSSQAVDLDTKDVISYSWSHDCGVDNAKAHFVEPSAAITEFISDIEQFCKLTLTVKSNKFTDSETLDVTFIEQGSGTLALSAYYAPNPRLNSINGSSNASNTSCTIELYNDYYASYANAMCPKAFVTGSTSKWSAYSMDWGAKEHKDRKIEASISDGCGSIEYKNDYPDYPTYSYFLWTHSTVGNIVCMATFKATNYIDIVNGDGIVIDKKPLIGQVSVGVHFVDKVK